MEVDNEDKPVDEYNLSRKIFVGNISYRVRQDQLSKHFSEKFGDVDYCYLVKDHIRKWSKGIAFITFKTRESAEKALKASEKQLQLDSRLMRVAPAEESKRVSIVKDTWNSCSSASENERESSPEIQAKELQDLTIGTCKSCEINRLPDDSLIHIFSLLPLCDHIRIERVCRRWQKVAAMSWSSFTKLKFYGVFKGFGRALTDQIFSAVLQRCGLYLRELDLSSTPMRLTDVVADIIGEKCPNLQDINLSKIDLTNVSLRTMAQRCQQLKRVKFHSCHHIGDKGINFMFQGCTKLETVDLGNNKNLVGDGFHTAGNGLRSLILEDCSKLTDMGVKKIGIRCKHLEELDLSRCVAITDVSLTHIVQNMKKLKTLSLQGIYPNMTEAGLLQITKLHNLRELNLAGNRTVDDIFLISLTCPNLEGLDISECHRNVSEAGLLSLARFNDLKDLNVSYIPQVTDTTLHRIAVNGKIESLTARVCPGLTDEGVMILADLCPNLVYLDLSGCVVICNNTLNHFINNQREADRKHLTLKLGGTSVEDKNVDLSGCQIDLMMFDLSTASRSLDHTVMLPVVVSDSEEDAENEETVPSYGVAAGAEISVDEEWDMYEDGQFHYEDDYLVGDDPMAEECWDVS